MDIRIIKNLYDKSYESITMYKEYTIIKNCNIKTLVIDTRNSNITVKGIIFLNCKINRLEFDEVCVNILHIINSHINMICLHYNPFFINYGAKINYLKLYNSNIVFLDFISLLYNKKKSKLEKINTYIAACSDCDSYKFYKKINKKLFYSLKKMKY